MLIKTKYIGPTNHHGARILVRGYSKRIFVSWDGEVSVEGNHDRAARQLALSLGLFGHWFRAEWFDTSGYVYVRTPSLRSMAFSIPFKKEESTQRGELVPCSRGDRPGPCGL